MYKTEVDMGITWEKIQECRSTYAQAAQGDWISDEDGRIECFSPNAEFTKVCGLIATMADHSNVNTISRTGECFSHADSKFITDAHNHIVPELLDVAEAYIKVRELLRHLLSCVHRDGGRYTVENGLDASTCAAIDICTSHNAFVDRFTKMALEHDAIANKDEE